HRPQRIPRVDAHPDEIPARVLDQLAELARLHVAGVVLHRQLESRVDHAGAHAAEDRQGLGNTALDAAGAAAIGDRSEDAPHEWQPDNLRRGNYRVDLILDRAL